MKKNLKNYLTNILNEPSVREIQTFTLKRIVIILKRFIGISEIMGELCLVG